MTRLTITSKDAERIARSFSDLISKRGLQAIRRRAVNEIGSGLRKATRAIAPDLIGTSAAALSVQGRAASPGSDNPTYRLRMARKIPVIKMRAKNRKISRSRGRASLTIKLPNGKTISFRSIARDGSRFRLLQAGPLPERDLSGIYVNPGTAFADELGYPELVGLRKRAEKELSEVVAKHINQHFARRRG